MSTYRLATEWRLAAPVESVWAAIARPADWPRWWRHVEAVTELEPGGRRSAHRMMKPPMMKVLATTVGVNRWALMALPNSRPSTTAGRKAISTLSAKRRAFGWRGSATTVEWILCQKTSTTAKMAPVWIAMSKTLALSSSKPSSEPARIRWPVDEIGRNSVRPSTIPMMAALTSKTMSTRAPGKDAHYRCAAPEACHAGPDPA
jgi:hypothetical protein